MKRSATAMEQTSLSVLRISCLHGAPRIAREQYIPGRDVERLQMCCFDI
jgi:hypothetical protein